MYRRLPASLAPALVLLAVGAGPPERRAARSDLPVPDREIAWRRGGALPPSPAEVHLHPLSLRHNLARPRP